MNKQRLGQDQRGIVSILVTMVIMLIISLIVIGFARLSQREQRQALDRQLSTQAFYAAETGIKDAIEAIRANPGLEKTDCSSSLGASAGSNVIDSTNNVAYTCVLVDTSPSSLDYASIDVDQGTVIPIEPRSGSLERLTIGWQDKAGGSSYGGCPTPSGGAYVFPAAANWPSTCSAGVLRIDLVPNDHPMTRAGLISRTLTAYLYPQNGATSATSYTYNLGAPDQGAVIPVNCNTSATPRNCNISISFTGNAGVSSYYLRARSIYRSSNMSLAGYANGNVATELINAQAVIDSTGKANDVLRRISVRVPLTNIGANVPSFALLTADSLCKRFSIAPNVNPRAESGDAACQID
jgi:hypothetical protein